MSAITVFTPTYNRGYTLKRLYDSLRNQTCHDFDWLVIDDGSTDNTEDLFNQWKNDKNNFETTYIKVPHGGKHRAINKALKIAKGDYFFFLDSDDYLLNDAMQYMIQWSEGIDDKDDICGVSGQRGGGRRQTAFWSWSV